MKKTISLFILLMNVFFIYSCSERTKTKADEIFYNATVYTLDSSFSICDAFVVSNGKILATGQKAELLQKYEIKKETDLKGKTVFPGFIDAHCHFFNYGLGLQEINLVGTKSFDEVLEKIKRYSDSLPAKGWIVGRGWDQNDWPVKKFPEKSKLDILFPNTPVFLMRVDGHAALANQAALDLAGIQNDFKTEGGKVLLEDGKLTGVLIDNAIEKLRTKIPSPNITEIEQALNSAEKNCFRLGLTTVDDAGLDKEIILSIKKLQESGKLKMRIYAMASSTDSNFNYFKNSGKIKTDRLNVRSFKFYADGALGSRGACLLNDYQDQKGWKGFLLSDESYFREKAKWMLENGFQMNTHCIGDSSDRIISQIYFETLNSSASKDPLLEKYRWRIEHAQVVNKVDLQKFSYLIPSVQPTHATSDMYWAEERLGERVTSAYSYKDLLNVSGILALGTDFPVEDISPIKTFYAAVARKDAKGFPTNGFQMENALSRADAIRGMTIWAAYSNFEETEKGSIEKGKYADFVVLDRDLMKINENEILNTRILFTFLNGEKVFHAD